jgi:two-component sensor histidine kinase/streptogramin lyase
MRLNSLWLCCFCLLLFAMREARAQQPMVQHWSQASGIPSNIVFDAVQDHRGYIWFGNEKGLSRFDGKDAITYTHPKMNGTAVSNVFEDGTGRIWCQNFIGQLFYVLNDSMYFEQQIANNSNYAPMLLDAKGQLVTALGNKIQIYDQKERKLLKTLEVDEEVYTLHQQQNKLWAMTSSKLYRFQDGEREQTLELTGLPVLGANLLASIGDKIYAFPKTGNSGLVYELGATLKPISVLPPDQVIQSVRVFADTMLWVGTTGGLYLFDRNFKPYSWLPQPLLSGRSVSSTMVDANGAYWVTTIDNGVYRIPDLRSVFWETQGGQFTVFNHQHQDSKVLVGTESGDVLEVSDGGLSSFVSAKAKHRVNVVFHDESKERTVVAADRVYVSQNGTALNTLTVAGKDILSTYDDGPIVMAATGTVKLLDPQKPKAEMKHIGIGSADFRSTAAAYNSRTGKAQVATSLGIWEFDPKTDSVAVLLYGDVLANRLVWVGDTLIASTLQEGILMLRDGKVIGNLEQLQGPFSRMELVEKVLYVRKERTVHAIDTRTWKNRTVNTSFLNNGDVITDFTVRNGQLFLAAGNRIIRSELNFGSDPRVVPLVELTEFRSNDRPIAVIGSISLHHDQNSIQLHYSVPWFGDLSALAVQYRVNDGLWQTNDPMSRTVNLPFLSPGNYRLELRTLLSDGRVSESTSVEMRIRPPLYKRWWFQLGGMLLLAVAFYALYRYRVRLMGRQNLLLQEKLKLEQDLERSVLASIRSQMNPHFIFNALNTIQSYIYMNDRTNAVNYLGKFAQLTRKVLDLSMNELVTLREELDALNLYLELEKMRFEESLEVEMTVDLAIDQDLIKIPPMLIQPYVENALKHGLLHRKEYRKLSCSFRADGAFLVVTITDNGVGRKRSEELNAKASRHRPFSTEATQKRIELMNKALPHGFAVEYVDHRADDGQAEGTTVVLRMPIAAQS